MVDRRSARIRLIINITHMALIKWEPFNEIDRFFENFPPLAKVGWDLAVDVYEKDNTLVAEMNLPGIDPEKISISVEDGYLRVAGSREESKEEKKKHFYSKEIRRGSFERVVRLPSVVQKDKVTAEYKNGALRITLPKAKEIAKEKIKVQIKK